MVWALYCRAFLHTMGNKTKLKHNVPPLCALSLMACFYILQHSTFFFQISVQGCIFTSVLQLLPNCPVCFKRRLKAGRAENLQLLFKIKRIQLSRFPEGLLQPK